MNNCKGKPTLAPLSIVCELSLNKAVFKNDIVILFLTYQMLKSLMHSAGEAVGKQALSHLVGGNRNWYSS